MHVGMASVFQNPKKGRTDREVYRSELRLADLAEPLGYESVWGVEHHFTDYTMCPDVLQFLTYVAGRTQKAQLGGTPGRAPIGYLNIRRRIDGREVRTIAVDPDRAPLIQWAFNAYSTGDWSVGMLAEVLAYQLPELRIVVDDEKGFSSHAQG